MSEFELPDVMDISPEAIAAVENSLSPDPVPPPTARRDVDRKGNEYFRWSEQFVLEALTRSVAPSGLTVYFVQAKIRPNGEENHKNAGKRVYSRYRINYKVISGSVENPGHEIMNRLSLRSLVSLLKATEAMPDDVGTKGLGASYLMALFPKEEDIVQSPLIGRIVTGTVVNSPDKRENARNPRNNEVETWLPEVE
jgi:hypothetical protein